MKLFVTGGAGFIGSNFILYMMDKYPQYQIVNYVMGKSVNNEIKLLQAPADAELVSVYQGHDLRSSYLQVLQEAREDKDRERACEYFLSILDRAYQSLQQAGQRLNKEWKIPDAYVEIPTGEDPTGDAYTDERGIHIGLGLLLSLEAGILAFTQFLLQNYRHQVNPGIGAGPPLSKLVTSEAFPSEALKLYSANLVPEAVAKDGYEKGVVQSIMETMDRIWFAKVPLDELPIELSRRIIKPALDVGKWLSDFNLIDSINCYFDSEIGPYYLALNYQLMLDAVHFILAHEMAHFLLGHLQAAPNFAQERAEEVEADKLALKIVDFLPDFKLGSLLPLFGFLNLTVEEALRQQDEGRVRFSLESLSHPFSRDRMLILCETALRRSQDEALRADVNAGMSMLTTRVGVIHFRHLWEDGSDEKCLAMATYYSDMDYAANLFLYLEHPLNNSFWIDKGAWQNVYLLTRQNLEVQMILRDRTSPGIVYHRGRVLFRPGMSRKGDWLFHNLKPPMCRLQLRLVAPPEWWLTNRNTVLGIESIRVVEEVLPEAEDKFSPVVQYDIPEVKFDYAKYLETTSRKDLEQCALVLLAARRFHEEKFPSQAVLFYEWLYQSNRQMLLYPDLINLALDLLELNRPKEATDIAKYALGEERIMRPGFHFVLAKYFFSIRQFSDSMEHAFLEWFGIGEFGTYCEEAKKFYSFLLNNIDDPLMDLMRKFHFCYKKAEEYRRQEQTLEAVQFYRQAYMYLDIANEMDTSSFIFLRQQAAETLKEICSLEKTKFTQVKKDFEDVIQMAPQFVPAQIQLAKIALLENDLHRAQALWKEANSKMPFNNWVLYFRDKVEERNPKLDLYAMPR